MISLNDENYNSTFQWSELLEVIIRDPNIFNNSDYIFLNELNLAEFLDKEIFRKIVESFVISCEEINNQDETKYEIYKKEGNNFFKSNDLHYALICFTKALYSCKKDTSAAVCHANRAASLIKLEYYEEAYDDCEAAIHCNYPKDKIIKVFARQGFCAVKLKDQMKLEKVITNLQKLPKENIIAKEVLKLNDELKMLKIELSNSVEAKNELKQNLEKKTQILVDSIKGKFVVAREPIMKNETIIIEKAFAFVPVQISPKFINCHCETCGKVNVIPFPCYNCSLVSFCSLKCRNELEQIHQVECIGIKRNILMQIGIGHLALRTLLLGINELKSYLVEKFKFNSKMKSKEEIWQLIENFKESDSSAYAAVLGLNTNLDKMRNADYKRYAVTGSMLMIYLKCLTNFFEIEFRKDFYYFVQRTDWEIIINSLIIRHLAQMVSNAHTISEFRITYDQNLNIWKSKDKLNFGYLSYIANSSPIFAAIYPHISLCNHSCESNFYNKFNKINLNVIAMENIETNEEILNCYGKNFKLIDLKTRQKELKAQYHFICKCKHCCNSYDVEFKRHHTLKCFRKTCEHEFSVTFNWWEKHISELKNILKCPKCKTTYNIDWLIEWRELNTEIEFYNKILKNSDLVRIFEIYEAAEKYLVGHHIYKQILISQILNLVIQVLMVNKGLQINKNIAQNLIYLSIKNLDTTECIFNFNSVEYITVVAYFLDLIANLKLNKIDIKIDYDLEKIKQSFEFLSEDTRKLFLNYFFALKNLMENENIIT